VTRDNRPRLLALFAEPLLGADGNPVSRLETDLEREELAEWLGEADIDLDFEPGSLDELEKGLWHCPRLRVMRRG